MADRYEEIARRIVDRHFPWATAAGSAIAGAPHRLAAAIVTALRDQDLWYEIDDPEHPAPRDGTHILVCFGDPPYSHAWTFFQKPPTVAHWFGPPDLPGLRSGGWYLSVNHADSNRIYPTHYRPPPPPQSVRQDG